MALSVTINTPMPNATVTSPFSVNGTYTARSIGIVGGAQDRNLALLAPAIFVTVTKGANSYGPFWAIMDNPLPGQWQATATGIPNGLDYTVTAKLTQGMDIATHVVEYVDVNAAPGIQMDPPPHPMATLLAANAVRQAKTLTGTYDPNIGSTVRCIVMRVHQSHTHKTTSCGGNHDEFRYHLGRPLRMKEDPNPCAAARTWSVTIDVEPNTVVVALLLNNTGEITGTTASTLF